MTPHTLPAVRSVTAAFVLLAGVTGLLWPKSNIQAQYFDQPPTPVKTIPYRQGSPSEIAPGAQGWPSHDVNVPMAIWRVRSDGLWVPWTMDPPAWYGAIASSSVVAEAVPLPPERPAQPIEQLKPHNQKERYEPFIPTNAKRTDPQKRMAREGDICAQHGLTKTYTDKYRWRCRP